jgi:hypothetical protein
MLASRPPFDLHIAIADDIFPRPGQIRSLTELLRQEPDRAQGVAGQRLEMDQGTIKLKGAMT